MKPNSKGLMRGKEKAKLQTSLSYIESESELTNFV
jgi:hypothetical protein